MMKTKLGAAILAAMMMFGLFGVVSATADPGPNGNNDKGLCTAYFNGQKKGHDKHESQPGPFAALQDHAEEEAPRNNDDDDENDVTGVEAIFNYCDGMIEGNPDHGRYLCTSDDPETDEDEFGCEDNTEPGNGNGSTSGAGNAGGRG